MPEPVLPLYDCLANQTAWVVVRSADGPAPSSAAAAADYDCGETAAGRIPGGTRQSTFFGSDPRATGGYHNFSAQAGVLQRLVASGVVRAHWGTCEYSTGDAPPAFVNHAGGRGGGGGRAGGRHWARLGRAARRRVGRAAAGRGSIT